MSILTSLVLFAIAIVATTAVLLFVGNSGFRFLATGVKLGVWCGVSFAVLSTFFPNTHLAVNITLSTISGIVLWILDILVVILVSRWLDEEGKKLN